jgi:hypothetical protein
MRYERWRRYDEVDGRPWNQQQPFCAAEICHIALRRILPGKSISALIGTNSLADGLWCSSNWQAAKGDACGSSWSRKRFPFV